MRKIILSLGLLIFVFFSIPIIFTSRKVQITSIETNILDNIGSQENLENQNNIENQVKNDYDYKKYSKIKLLHSEENKIEEIGLDEYLYGVVSAEMPVSFEKEALKAQAVVARTYTIYKISNNDNKHKDADICDDPGCCQAWISKEDRIAKWDKENQEEYWGKIKNAVDETQGKFITYNGKPINAFFHANSGGATETPVNVWGGTEYPYLQTVVTSGEDAYSQYHSELLVSQKEFKEIIQNVHSDFKIDFSKDDCIEIIEYTDGNRVKEIKVGNLNLSGVEMRNLFNLRSANFKITMEEDNINFEVIGYGHGVGMSQTGADSLAKQGKNYEEIIHHYYTDVKIENM